MIHSLLIILNLILLEGLLSVDNAAVLAIVVKHLPEKDQKHALRWGLLGAYVLRGSCLVLASWLLKFYWLKILGGLYLLYLTYGFFSKDVETAEEIKSAETSGFYAWVHNKLHIPILWSTIILVEWLDLVFSIDNIFAAVALSQSYWVILTGVFIGILAMRMVAGWFLTLMKRYPSLEKSAFIVIGLLGIKLIISALAHYIGGIFSSIMEWSLFDLIFSLLMMGVFFKPIVFKSSVSSGTI